MENDNIPEVPQGLPADVVERLRNSAIKAMPPEEVAPPSLWCHEIKWYENDKRLRVKERCNPIILVEGAQRNVPRFSYVIVIPVPQVEQQPPFDIVEQIGEVEIPIEAESVEDAFRLATQELLQKAANIFHQQRMQAAHAQQAQLRRSKPLIATARSMPPRG